MVIDKCHRVLWFFLHDCVVQDISQVVMRVILARVIEIRVQRHIEKCSLCHILLIRLFMVRGGDTEAYFASECLDVRQYQFQTAGIIISHDARQQNGGATKTYSADQYSAVYRR
jgi:hypothetical protein